MVNIIIYLDENFEAPVLVEELLKERLAAKISIDKDNVSYYIEDGHLVTKTRTVLTLQTKALHFSAIDKFLQDKFGEQVPLCSVPITQVNKRFDQFIRENTSREND
jgi:uncharacterized protein involved in tolerance to divalent cations